MRSILQEQHLIYDPSSPVIPETGVRSSTAQDTFESLLDEGEAHIIRISPFPRSLHYTTTVRRDELSSIPLPRDGYRTRYAPRGSAHRHTDREQPSILEFLNSSEDHFAASDTGIATDATALKDDINSSCSTSAYNTFSSKENVKSSRSPSAANTSGLKASVKSSGSPSTANTSGLKEIIKSSGSPSTVNTFAPNENVKSSGVSSAADTSAPKANVKPSGPPSFATLRHKLSSMLSGEGSGRDYNRNQVTTPIATLPGNIATAPIHDSGVFVLSNQQGQATQIQETSAGVARPAAMINSTKIASTATTMSSTDTASSVSVAGSTTMGSPAIAGSHISTSSFAAKIKDKATHRKHLLTLDTTRSNMDAPTSTASSSAYGQSKNQNDEFGSPKTGPGFMTRSGPSDQLFLSPQEAYEDEVPICTRSRPIIDEFEAAYPEEASGVTSTKDLIAAVGTSTATTEPSSSFMSPTNLVRALRRNFANLKLAKPDTTRSSSNANKGAVQSPNQAGSNASKSVYRNWDANEGTVRSPGESSVPPVNPHREPMYSQPPSPEISRFRQASTSAHKNQHAGGPMATTGTTSKQASPTSPGQFRIPRKSVGSGDTRAVSTGKKVQKEAQSCSQGESSTSGAQGKEKPKESAKDLEAKAKMEREDFVAFKVSYQFVFDHCYSANHRIKVNELREQTGSQVVWYKPDDLRCMHPNHHRTWYSKNLWCATHSGACANCGAPCCAMAGAIKIVEENRGPATAVAAAKALSQAIGRYVTTGTEECTLMECTSCHRLVCPECCSVCPIGACGDRVCNAPVSDYSQKLSSQY